MQKVILKQALDPENPELALTGEHWIEDSDPFEQALAEFPRSDDATITVNRVLPNNQLSFMFSYHPDEYTISQLQTRLRDEFGGGKFRVRGMFDKKVRLNNIIHVDPPRKTFEQPLPQNNQQAQNNNEIVMAMMQSMQRGFQELGQFIAQSNLAQSRAPTYDPLEAEDRFMQRMLQMKQLFQNERSPETPPYDLFIKGLEFGKEVIGNTGESTTMDVIRDALKTLGPSLMMALTKNAGQAQQVPQRQAPPHVAAQVAQGRMQPLGEVPIAVTPALVPGTGLGQSVAQTENVMQTAVNTPEDEMLKVITDYLKNVVEQAKINAPVEPVAKQIIADFGEDQVATYIESGNFLQQMGNYVPDVYSYVEWFNKLTAAIEAEIYEDDLPDTKPVPIAFSVEGDIESRVNPDHYLEEDH